MQRVLFRLDAASFLGMGHAYQSLALAEAFQEKGITAHFAVKELESDVLTWIASHGVKVFPLPPDVNENAELQILIPYLTKNSIPFVIIDHHELGYNYTLELRKNGLKVAVIDDEGMRRFCCDILINYNIYAKELNFDIEPHTQCLLGPEYVILRSQFYEDPNRTIYNNRLLVTIGGGYARGEVIKVLDALMILDDNTVRHISPLVVLGPKYPSPKKLLEKYSHLSVTFAYNVENMRSLMELADFTISAGGGTLYELARMGLPSIIIVLDDNQKLNADSFHRAGVGKNLGWFVDVTSAVIAEEIQRWINAPDMVKQMRVNALKLVDSQGSNRVIKSIMKSL